MFNSYVFSVAYAMRNQNVEYAFFVQKFVEFNLIRFQLNYKRAMRLRMSNMYI